jgi:hypothetical protein
MLAAIISTKVTRRDGSVDIDGVQVVPPVDTAPEAPAAVEPPSTELVKQTTAEADTSQDYETMLAELEQQVEGKPAEVKAPEAEQVVVPEAPAEITAPMTPTGGPSAPIKVTEAAPEIPAGPAAPAAVETPTEELARQVLPDESQDYEAMIKELEVSDGR